MKRILAGLIAAGAMLMCACDEHPSTDRTQAARQEKVAAQADAQVGMPGVTNFTERKLMRRLYELRDQEIVTFAYVPDMNGRLFHLCDSIGYGLPYGTQFTNPERVAGAWETPSTGNLALPQPEPNGLFMPPGAEGTWIMCGSKGDTRPVYVEPRVIVSPFKLAAAGDYAVK